MRELSKLSRAFAFLNFLERPRAYAQCSGDIHLGARIGPDRRVNPVADLFFQALYVKLGHFLAYDFFSPSRKKANVGWQNGGRMTLRLRYLTLKASRAVLGLAAAARAIS
ncbi:MAG: hypothetical protein CR217_03980 [Beijerinckiaceae bacterium]|nr:MAG: hypothetical protein CR217_03980 [Beijerinckiaceae bacterium]